jgi:replicative DNA helicase
MTESFTAERACIAAAMQNGTTADSVLELLTPEQFLNPPHRTILATIAALRETAHPIDLILLTTEMEKRGTLAEVGGEFYLTELATLIADSSNWQHYATEVIDRWKRREMRAAALKMAEAANDFAVPVEDTQEICEQVFYSLRENINRENPVAHCRDAVVEAVEHIELSHKSRGKTIGIPSGLYDIDRCTGGFLGGQLIIIAARPGGGKSALGLQLAMHAVEIAQVPTLFFSLEMPGRDLMKRAICSGAQVNLQRVRDGFFNERQVADVSKVATAIVKTRLYLDPTSGLSVAQFRARSRRAHAHHKIGLIVVDYLQIMQGTASVAKQSRALEVSEIARALKHTAKELHIPVIALAQLNRDAEGSNSMPKLHNLSESDSIGREADVVFLLHRLDKQKNRRDEEEEDSGHNAILNIAKQREGPGGADVNIKLNFIKEYTRFENITEKQYSNNINERQK